nr:hypothetical protein [Tanacetum cinerariifolium]
EIDFNISFDESDNEDYMVIFHENSISCKTISVNNLKTDSEDENDKVNMPSSLSPEPTFGYIDDLNFFKDFENEFPSIAYNDLKSKSDTQLNLPARPSYVFIRDPMRRLCYRIIACSFSGMRHAHEKEDGARLSGALFIGHLAAHFRLVGDKGLRSLSVVAWVASRPERHQAATAGAPVAVEDTPVGDAGAPTVPAPLQAPQPSPAPQHRTMS